MASFNYDSPLASEHQLERRELASPGHDKGPSMEEPRATLPFRLCPCVSVSSELSAYGSRLHNLNLPNESPVASNFPFGEKDRQVTG